MPTSTEYRRYSTAELAAMPVGARVEDRRGCVYVADSIGDNGIYPRSRWWYADNRDDRDRSNSTLARRLLREVTP